jgi:hypothetical protein
MHLLECIFVIKEKQKMEYYSFSKSKLLNILILLFHHIKSFIITTLLLLPVIVCGLSRKKFACKYSNLIQWKVFFIKQNMKQFTFTIIGCSSFSWIVIYMGKHFFKKKDQFICNFLRPPYFSMFTFENCLE